MSLEQPVFIGNFRSGTTLLINLLGLHDCIAPWFETKGICEALRWLHVLNNPEVYEIEQRLIKSQANTRFCVDVVAENLLNDFRSTAARINGGSPSGKASNERYPIGYDYVLYSLEEAEKAVSIWCDDLTGTEDPDSVAKATGKLIRYLGDRHAELAGKSQWINKTPEIPRFAAELRQCLGRCKVILLVRNGIEVVRSAINLGWGQPAEIAAWWQGMIEQSRIASVNHEDDYLEVHYEALLENPIDVIQSILDFIGITSKADALVNLYHKAIPLNRHPAQKVNLSDDVIKLIDTDFLASLGYR